MNSTYQTGFLEKFGLYYLRIFRRKTLPFAQLPDDQTIKNRVNRITIFGILSAGLMGVLCVFPMIWVDVKFESTVWYIHYGWVALATIFFTLIEFYLLFLISLRSVHEVAEIVNIHATNKEYQLQGPFSILNILSRTALEINEPEMDILGINPFQKVSRKNLLLLGFMYKLKIILSNIILKYFLLFLFGKNILGVSILYEALLVECFWNMVVIRKVILESRLRLFGFVLANQITDQLSIDQHTLQLSPQAKIACLRAIGNTIVLTKNYHPNMVILLLEFKNLFEIHTPAQLDDWKIFIENLSSLAESEKNITLDVLCIAAAFDGKISDLERQYLHEAFKEHATLYFKRLENLQLYLTQGRIHAAHDLCKIDFVAG